MARTKHTQRTTQKPVEHQDATDIQKTILLCFSDILKTIEQRIGVLFNPRTIRSVDPYLCVRAE